MRKLPRLFGKKKGTRITGSPQAAGVGEVIFSSILALLGLSVLIMLVASQVSAVVSQSAANWLVFSLQMFAAIALLAVGVFGILRIFWELGASAERRRVLADRALEIGRLGDPVGQQQQFLNVPFELRRRVRPGSELKYRLLPRKLPRWNLIAAGSISIIFVALASSTIVMTWLEIVAGRLDIFGSLLSVALIIASVWSFRLFVRQLLKLTGIGDTQIELDRYPLVCGKSCTVSVTQFGRVRLKLFDLLLDCNEEVTFRDGTEYRTECQQVSQTRIYRSRGVQLNPANAFTVNCRFTIPPTAMHSFQSPHNRVMWSLSVLCTSRGWPDQLTTFPLLVLPYQESLS